MDHLEKQTFTELEYLENEILSTEKHEYYQGEIFDMAGAIEAVFIYLRHKRIVLAS